jgi:hypothetical protein
VVMNNTTVSVEQAVVTQLHYITNDDHNWRWGVLEPAVMNFYNSVSWGISLCVILRGRHYFLIFKSLELLFSITD